MLINEMPKYGAILKSTPISCISFITDIHLTFMHSFMHQFIHCISHTRSLRLKRTIRSCKTSRLEPRHSYKTRRQARVMENEFNERIERMERAQKELQEQLAKSQQETRDLMVKSREESLEQRDQMAKMMEMMTTLVKGKMQNPDVMEPQSRIHHY